MTETVPIDRPPAARATVSRPRSRKAATVSASALAQHLDCSRTYIGKLEAEGVIQRQGDGFPLDQCRVAYLRYLRRERQQSPRAVADAEHAAANAVLLRLRIEEKQRKLVRQTDVDELIDQLRGITLTHLSGMAARCTRDMQVRRNIDAVVMQVRREISEVCSKASDERNEPPLDEQADSQAVRDVELNGGISSPRISHHALAGVACGDAGKLALKGGCSGPAV
jgi:hypothetical protein